TCNLYDLETSGGAAGAALHARSRETAPAPPPPSQYVARQKITLASGSLRKSLPIEDIEPDIDLDDEAADAQPSAAAAGIEPDGEAMPEDDTIPATAAAQSEPPQSA